MNPKLALSGVRIVQRADESPDLSYLGRYCDSPDQKEGEGEPIDREARGDMGEGEFRWFIPAMTEGAEEDYQRMESYGVAWHCLKISAEAEVLRDIGGGARQIHRFESGGLWGIESDSDDAHIAEIEQHELRSLKRILKDFGVDVSAFDGAADLALVRREMEAN